MVTGSSQVNSFVPFYLNNGVITSEWVKTKSDGWLQMRVVKEENKVRIQIITQGVCAHLFSQLFSFEWGVSVKFAYDAPLENNPVDKTLKYRNVTIDETLIKKMVNQKGKHLTELFFGLHDVIEKQNLLQKMSSAAREVDRQLTFVNDTIKESKYPVLVKKFEVIKTEFHKLKSNLYVFSRDKLEAAQALLVSLSEKASQTIQEVVRIEWLHDEVNAVIKSLGRVIESLTDIKATPGFQEWEAFVLNFKESEKNIESLEEAKLCKAQVNLLKITLLHRIITEKIMMYGNSVGSTFLATHPTYSNQSKFQINAISNTRVQELQELLSQISFIDPEKFNYEIATTCETTLAHSKQVDTKLLEVIKGNTAEPNLSKYLEEVIKQIKATYDKLVGSKKDQPKVDLTALTLSEVFDKFSELEEYGAGRWTPQEMSLFQNYMVLKDVVISIVNADTTLLSEVKQYFDLRKRSILADNTSMQKQLSADEFSVGVVLGIYQKLLNGLPRINQLQSVLERPLNKIALQSPQWIEHYVNIEGIWEGLQKIIPQLKSFGPLYKKAQSLCASDSKTPEVKKLVSSIKKFEEKCAAISTAQDVVALGEEITRLEKTLRADLSVK